MRPTPFSIRSTRRRAAFVVMGLWLPSAPGLAQTTVITPQLGARALYTDNVSLAAPGKESSEFVLDIMPRISARYTGGRLKADVDYTLHALNYLNGTASSRTANALLGNAKLEVLDNQLFIDARASISTAAISALGAQPVDVANRSRNQSEVRTLALSPYLRGLLPSVAGAYDLRYTRTSTSASGTSLASTDSDAFVAQVKDTSGARIGWRGEANLLTQRFSNRPDIRRDSYRGILDLNVDRQTRLYGFVGHEDGTLGISQYSRAFSGAGFNWRPTERTEVSGEQSQRYFGTSYNYRVSHRTGLTAWDVGFSRAATTLQEQLFQANPGDVYALLYNAYASRIPEADQRDQAIRQFLATTGMSRILTSQVNFITNRVFLQRMLYASAAITGQRNTLTFSVTSTDREAMDTGIALADDFLLSPRLKTRSWGVNWNHKLTPLSSLDLLLSDLSSRGIAGQSASRRMGLLTLSTKLGPTATGSLGFRATRFDASTLDFSEHAVIATVNSAF